MESPWTSFFKSSHTCLKRDKSEGYITRCMSQRNNSRSTNFMDRCFQNESFAVVNVSENDEDTC